MGNCKIWKREAVQTANTGRVSWTRVVSHRLDTGRVPQAEGISSLVLLYYLSNATYSKWNKLRYDDI